MTEWLAAGDARGLPECDRWLRNRRLGDEVINGVLVKLWMLQQTARGRTAMHEIRNWRAFISRLIRNAREDFRRTTTGRSKRRRVQLPIPLTSRGARDPKRIANANEAAVAVLRAILKLGSLQRTALVATRLLGETYREAARRIYGDAAGAKEDKRVGSLVLRAIAKLRSDVPDLEAWI